MIPIFRECDLLDNKPAQSTSVAYLRINDAHKHIKCLDSEMSAHLQENSKF